MNSSNDFYIADTEERIGVNRTADSSVVEQNRIIQDKSGLWLCQSRYFHKPTKHITGWQTSEMCETREEARKYFENMPDWVKRF